MFKKLLLCVAVVAMPLASGEVFADGFDIGILKFKITDNEHISTIPFNEYDNWETTRVVRDMVNFPRKDHIETNCWHVMNYLTETGWYLNDVTESEGFTRMYFCKKKPK